MAATAASTDRPANAEPPRKELRSVVERVTYQNPENGFTVTRLLPQRGETEARAEDDRLVTVVGTLSELQPGEAVVARDWWRNHPNSDRQGEVLDAAQPRKEGGLARTPLTAEGEVLMILVPRGTHRRVPVSRRR